MLAPSCQAQVLGPLCSEVVGTLNQILGSGNSTTLFGFEHLYLGTRAQSLWQRSPTLKLEFRVFPKFPIFLHPCAPAAWRDFYYLPFLFFWFQVEKPLMPILSILWKTQFRLWFGVNVDAELCFVYAGSSRVNYFINSGHMENFLRGWWGKNQDFM